MPYGAFCRPAFAALLHRVPPSAQRITAEIYPLYVNLKSITTISPLPGLLTDTSNDLILTCIKKIKSIFKSRFFCFRSFFWIKRSIFVLLTIIYLTTEPHNRIIFCFKTIKRSKKPIKDRFVDHSIANRIILDNKTICYIAR